MVCVGNNVDHPFSVVGGERNVDRMKTTVRRTDTGQEQEQGEKTRQHYDDHLFQTSSHVIATLCDKRKQHVTRRQNRVQDE